MMAQRDIRPPFEEQQSRKREVASKYNNSATPRLPIEEVATSPLYDETLLGSLNR